MTLHKDTSLLEKLAWYCVKTQPRREKVAASQLGTLAGVKVFLPMVRYFKPGTRPPQEKVEPVFPGYLFVRFVPLENAHSVRYTQGVGRILKRGENYIAVNDAIIDELEAISDHGLVDMPKRSLRIGERVKVVAGIFADCDAEVVHILPAKQRVKVLIELLGRPNEIEIEEGLLDAEFDNPLSRQSAGKPS